MKNKNKIVSVVSTILLIALMLAYFPVGATTSNTLTLASPSATEHQQTIYQFIDELRSIKDKTFQLIQLALYNPLQDAANFERNISLVNNDAAMLRRKVLEYQTTISADTLQYKDVLLILNALNYSKNALFDLELLAQTSSNVDRAILLENFFHSRTEAIDALNIVENLVKGY